LLKNTPSQDEISGQDGHQAVKSSFHKHEEHAPISLCQSAAILTSPPALPGTLRALRCGYD